MATETGNTLPRPGPNGLKTEDFATRAGYNPTQAPRASEAQNLMGTTDQVSETASASVQPAPPPSRGGDREGTSSPATTAR